MKTIEGIIELLKKAHKDKVSKSLSETDTLMKKLNILKKIKRKDIKTEQDIKNAMELGLCYNHLAFCCSMARECIFRDAVLDAIGWKETDFNNYKTKCSKLFWDIIIKKENK